MFNWALRGVVTRAGAKSVRVKRIFDSIYSSRFLHINITCLFISTHSYKAMARNGTAWGGDEVQSNEMPISIGHAPAIFLPFFLPSPPPSSPSFIQ